MCPGSIGAVGEESSFQRPVHSFNHDVGFRVVGCCMVTHGIEELVGGGPKEGCERGTLIGDNVLRDAESGDPCREEGCFT